MTAISNVETTSFPVDEKRRSYNARGAKPAAKDRDNAFSALFQEGNVKLGHAYDIACKWEPLRNQILSQWPNIGSDEIDAAGPNLGYLTTLISSKYRLDYQMIKNYLSNLTRHLPLA